MITFKNFKEQNDDVKIVMQNGPFEVIEYLRDFSVAPWNAEEAYFVDKMNIHKKQLVCDLSKGHVVIQPGAMQWMAGNVQATTGIKGVGDLFSKGLRSMVTDEAVVKPEYTGTGTLVLEPTYKYIIMVDVADWGGKVVLDDGAFMACEATLRHKTVMRSNISSAVAGGEGLFNLALEGKGWACLESMCPQEELVEVTLEDDVLKIDGNLALAWSDSLEFKVERSGKTLVGSGVSKEGLVNTYRGTGKVLMAPLDMGGKRPPAPAAGGVTVITK